MANDKSYVELTDENFQREVIESNKPVLVDFWAAWCGPCLMLAPAVEELADEYEGRAKVGKLNVDHNPQTAQRFGIRSIPTLLYFDGGQVVDQTVGVAPKSALVEKLNSLTKAAQTE